MKNLARRILLKTAHHLEVLSKQMRGAADKVIPEKRLFLDECESRNWAMVRPCFVLSTGRSGTLLLTNVLELAERCAPHHEPRPELYRPSRLAYERIQAEPDLFREILKSAREEYLLAAARREQVYVETNNQITFFAPIIRDIFPRAVFLHLVRHPGSFVRSGIRRRWYTGEHSHDIGRIVPMNGKARELWGEWSLIEKNGWLWNETNRFIETFKKTLPDDAVLTVKAEEFFADPAVSLAIADFLDVGPLEPRRVAAVLRRPANVQKKGTFPPYRDWSDADKARLKAVAPLAEHYGYAL